MLKCKQCHFKNPDGMNFCGMCGHPLQAGSAPAFTKTEDPAAVPGYAQRQHNDQTPAFLIDSVLKSRQAVEGENKRVAILFADVVGFTRIAEKTDPETLHRLMDGCFELLGEVIHGLGGTINQYTGDGIMAIFGAPIALEDYTAKACFAGLEIQRRLADYRALTLKQFGLDIQMRIGINTGQVLVGAIGDNLRLDYTAIGDTTNLAARLQASAAPGTIHVSRQVVESVGHLFHFKDLGSRRLKGKSHPQRIFRLNGVKTAPDISIRLSGPALKFMGRKQELARLSEAWRRACENGPVSLMLRGQTGIGKKRLLSHFLTGTVGRRAFLFSGRCQSYGQSTPFHIIMEILAKTFSSLSTSGHDRATAHHPLVDRTKKLFDRFTRLREQAEHLETLLDGRKRSIFSELNELFVAAAAIKPCVIAIDDCQWLDSYSLEFLHHLAACASSLPVLIICSGRRSEAQTIAHRADVTLELGPLDSRSSIALFAAALGAQRVDRLLRQIAIDRAGGNPLFLIELAASLRRSGQVTVERGRVILKSPTAELNLPTGIYDALAARLDALPEDDKRLLQLAAVVGSEFSLHLLEKAFDLPSAGFKELMGLEDAAVIERISADDDDRFRFKQQAMRDVAYEMMLHSTREQLHQRVGEALEMLHRDRLPDVMGQLAYHFYRAGQWSKALAYNLEAGQQARRVFACHTALACFDRMATILTTQRPEEDTAMLVRVLKWQGLMHYCTGRYDAALESFKAMLAEARKDRENPIVSEGLFRMGWIYFFLHQPRLALEHLSQAREYAQKHDQPHILLKATGFLGLLHLVLGRFQPARQLLIEALDLSETSVDVEASAWTLGAMIKHDNWTGEFDKALQRCDELAALNRHLQSRYFENFLIFHQGLIHTALGQWEEAQTVLKNGLAQLEPGDDRFWRPRMLNTLGWLLALQKSPRRALSLNRQALSEALDSGDPETIYNARVNIAENFLKLDDLPRARQEIEAVWAEIRFRHEIYAIWRFKTRARLTLARICLATENHRTALRHADGAYRAAVKTGAVKHQVMALKIRARIIRQSRPRKAARLLEQALSSAEKIKAQWLIDQIKEEHNALAKAGGKK
jgi:class 3 adenylate cyclase/tetratricopeptide (TPR) repeat protein